MINLLCEKTGVKLLVLLGLTAGRQSDEILVDCDIVIDAFQSAFLGNFLARHVLGFVTFTLHVFMFTLLLNTTIVCLLFIAYLYT